MNTLGIDFANLFIHLAIDVVPFLCLVLLFVFLRNKASNIFIAILGVLTAWVTLFYGFIELGVLGTLIFSLFSNPSQGIHLAIEFSSRFASVGSISSPLMILLFFYYIYRIIKSPLHSQRNRTILVLFMLIFPIIVMPLYYLRFVWKKKTPVLEINAEINEKKR